MPSTALPLATPAVTGAPLIGHDGASLIGHDGASVTSKGGGNIVAAGGGNVVAAGGGNIVAAGGGNLLSEHGAGLISEHGAGLISNAAAALAALPGANLAATSPNAFRQDSRIEAFTNVTNPDQDLRNAVGNLSHQDSKTLSDLKAQVAAGKPLTADQAQQVKSITDRIARSMDPANVKSLQAAIDAKAAPQTSGPASSTTKASTTPQATTNAAPVQPASTQPASAAPPANAPAVAAVPAPQQPAVSKSDLSPAYAEQLLKVGPAVIQGLQAQQQAALAKGDKALADGLGKDVARMQAELAVAKTMPAASSQPATTAAAAAAPAGGGNANTPASSAPATAPAATAAAPAAAAKPAVASVSPATTPAQPAAAAPPVTAKNDAPAAPTKITAEQGKAIQQSLRTIPGNLTRDEEAVRQSRDARRQGRDQGSYARRSGHAKGRFAGACEQASQGGTAAWAEERERTARAGTETAGHGNVAGHRYAGEQALCQRNPGRQADIAWYCGHTANGRTRYGAASAADDDGGHNADELVRFREGWRREAAAAPNDDAHGASEEPAGGPDAALVVEGGRAAGHSGDGTHRAAESSAGSAGAAFCAKDGDRPAGAAEARNAAEAGACRDYRDASQATRSSGA